MHSGKYRDLGFPSASWSRDGRRIAFAGPGDHARNLLVKDLASGVVKTLADPEVLGRPDWSPNGHKILFGYWDENAKDGFVGLVSSTGGRLHRIGVNAKQPSWAPDGRAIAYIANSTGGGNPYIVLADANGKGQRRLTPARMEAYGPIAWQPVVSGG